MKNAILILVFISLLSSCRKDDDNRPSESNRPSSFQVIDDSGKTATYEMSYTEFDKISHILISFDDRAFRMDFTYNDENLLTRFNNGNGTVIDIIYGTDGKLSRYSSLAISRDITETANGFITAYSLFTTAYTFNNVDQLTLIDDNLLADISFNVEAGSSGAFKNVDIDRVLYALPTFSTLFFNKQAFTSTVNYLVEPTLNFTNTFNDSGLLKKSIVYVTDPLNPKMTIEYAY